MFAVHHWVTHGYATYTTVLLVLWERGYVRRTPLGDPRVCHVYYGAIGTLGEGLCARRTPLGDPWVCHVYYGAIGTLGEGCARAVHHWVTHGYATYTTVL